MFGTRNMLIQDPTQSLDRTCPFMAGGERFLGVRVDAAPRVETAAGSSARFLSPSVVVVLRKELPASVKYITVLGVAAETTVRVSDVVRAVRKREWSDDAFVRDFLQGILIFSSTSREVNLAPDMRDELQKYGTVWVDLLSNHPLEHPRPGSYMIHHGHLFEIYRLHDDTQKAFIHAIIPSDSRYD